MPERQPDTRYGRGANCIEMVDSLCCSRLNGHVPEETACPDCGGAWTRLGEDVSEMLEFVPASLRVIRHVRPRLTCSCCERMAQAPAPSRPITRGLAVPGLLAHIYVSK